jgi:hypothetical protein
VGAAWPALKALPILTSSRPAPARRRMMLMVPATAWPLVSAVAVRRISTRSMRSGLSDSSAKPAGAGTPFSRIAA